MSVSREDELDNLYQRRGLLRLQLAAMNRRIEELEQPARPISEYLTQIRADMTARRSA